MSFFSTFFLGFTCISLTCIISASRAVGAPTMALNNSTKDDFISDDIPARKLLRTHEITDNEERINEINKLKSIMEPADRLAMWSYYETDDVFKAFQARIHKPYDRSAINAERMITCLAPSDIKLLIEFFQVSKKSLIGAFTKHYGDDIMAMVLLRARNSETEHTKEFATTLWKMLMKRWRNRDVFKLLKLDVEDPTFHGIVGWKIDVLEEFIKYMNSGVRNDEQMFEILIGGYGGVDIFLSLISEAKLHVGIVDKATDIETRYYQSLLRQLNPISDFLKKLKLKDEGYRVFVSPKLGWLEAFSKVYYKENPYRKEKDIFDLLKKEFGGTGKLAILISRAKRDPATSDKGTMYEKILFDRLFDEDIDPTEFLDEFRNMGKSERKMAQEMVNKYEGIWNRVHLYHITVPRAR